MTQYNCRHKWQTCTHNTNCLIIYYNISNTFTIIYIFIYYSFPFKFYFNNIYLKKQNSLFSFILSLFIKSKQNSLSLFLYINRYFSNVSALFKCICQKKFIYFYFGCMLKFIRPPQEQQKSYTHASSFTKTKF